MTKGGIDPDAPHLALLAVRARRLTDPLGAMGFRRTRERLRTERQARKMAFFASVGAFLGLFGVLATGGQVNTVSVAPAGAAVPAHQQLTDPSQFSRQTSDIAGSATQTKSAHVRTRSS